MVSNNAAAKSASDTSTSSMKDKVNLNSVLSELANSGYSNYNSLGQYNNLPSLADYLSEDDSSSDIFDLINTYDSSSSTSNLPDFLDSGSSDSGSADDMFSAIEDAITEYDNLLISNAIKKMNKSKSQISSTGTKETK
jgi:hypothetical protein